MFLKTIAALRFEKRIFRQEKLTSARRAAMNGVLGSGQFQRSQQSRAPGGTSSALVRLPQFGNAQKPAIAMTE
jgi:hypothetical protein